MKQGKCPHCGQIRGMAELDTVDACAPFSGFNNDGTPVSSGYTEIAWDTQAPRRSEDGHLLYICQECLETFSEIILVESDVEEQGE